jgi:hypothetical protein
MRAMENPLVMLGFLSTFHVIGAAALAYGLRGVWSGLRDKGRGVGSAFFFILWGTGFGCLPFAIGLGLATEDGGTPLVLLGQALIWGSAFLAALLAWDAILDWLRFFLHPDMFFIAFGGIFMLVGAIVGSLTLQDDPQFGLLFSGIFMLVGGIIFAIGVWRLLKEIR